MRPTRDVLSRVSRGVARAVEPLVVGLDAELASVGAPRLRAARAHQVRADGRVALDLLPLSGAKRAGPGEGPSRGSQPSEVVEPSRVGQRFEAGLAETQHRPHGTGEGAGSRRVLTGR